MYHYMQNIPSFYETVDEARKNMLGYDKNLLLTTPQTFLLEEINVIPLNGRINLLISNKDTTFECFFHYKPNKPLYVILNGARTAPPPEFKRWSWYPFIDGSMLNIADPMYRKYPGLNLGWYYDFYQEIATIATKFASLLGLSQKDIIFYGSSGGGSASIHCASIVKGSFSVSINPQIKLNKYLNHRQQFLQKTGIDLDLPDYRNDLSLIMKNNPDSHYLILQNLYSKEDMQMQDYIKQTIGINTHYGLSNLDSIYVWTYYSLSLIPHNAQENYIIYWVICYLIECIITNREIDKKLILFVTEFFYERSTHIFSKEKSNNNNRQFFLMEEETNVKDVLFKPSIHIETNDKWYHFIELYSNFEPNTIYELNIDTVEVLKGNIEKIIFAIKDLIQQQQKPILIKECSIHEPIKLNFVTPKQCNKFVLRIYANWASNTKNVTLNIINFKLKKFAILK